MKKYAKFLSLILALAMLFTLAACGGDDQKANTPDTNTPASTAPDNNTDTPAAEGDYPTVTWKLAHSAQEGGSSDQGCRAVKEFVEEKTGGKITIDLYPAGQLGSDMAQIESVQLGDLEFSSIGPYGLATSTAVWGTLLWDIPYFYPIAYDDCQDYMLLWDDPAWQNVYGEQLATKGIHTMGVTMEGDYVIFSNKPIESTEDLKGLKVRAAENAMVVDTLTEWGAQPTVVNMFELYTALEQGMVDAAYVAESVAHQFTLENACDYVTYFEGNPGPVMLICSEEFYNEQTPLVQELIDEMGQVYMESGFKAYETKGPEYLQAFKDAGCEVIFLTEEQKADWLAHMPNTYATWKEKVGADLFDQAADYIENTIKPAMQ